MSSPTSTEAAAPLEDRDHYLDLYRRMRLIRGFEDLIQSLFLRNEVYGTTHLYSGQEAVAVGFADVLGDRDRVAATYRGHGHALALGVDPQKLLDEMLGRATGINGGLAGSMNVTSPADRLIGCFGIVGGSIAAATGAGLSLQRTGGVAVAFFGDGATNHGYFHECLNFARVRKLPVLFVCENNLYGEFTPMAAVTAGGDIRARAAAYDMPAEKVDGNDVERVRAVAERAVDHARRGDGPAFLECLTYRHLGHSKTDPCAYRPEGELDEWLARDPLTMAAAKLAEAGVPAEEVAACAAAVRADVEAGVAAALADPYPDPAGAATEYAG
jgi:TPP-dependent pyruvate/acetoin dehydrogenase alpha subunit